MSRKWRWCFSQGPGLQLQRRLKAERTFSRSCKSQRPEYTFLCAQHGPKVQAFLPRDKTGTNVQILQSIDIEKKVSLEVQGQSKTPLRTIPFVLGRTVVEGNFHARVKAQACFLNWQCTFPGNVQDPRGSFRERGTAQGPARAKCPKMPP